MRDTPHDRDLAEILIECYENASLKICPSEYLVITRVFRPITRPNHIVSACLDFSPSAAPDAGVK
jgi:hypothetical protein